MFGFLKDKLKQAVSIFKKKVDEEVEDNEIEIEVKKPVGSHEEKIVTKKDEKVDKKDNKQEKAEKKEDKIKVQKETDTQKHEKKEEKEKGQKEEVKEEKKDKIKKKEQYKEETKTKEIENEKEIKESIKDIKKKKEEEISEEISPQKNEEKINEVEDQKIEEPEKKGFFQKIKDVFLSKKQEQSVKIKDPSKENQILREKKITEVAEDIKRLEEEAEEEKEIDSELEKNKQDQDLNILLKENLIEDENKELKQIEEKGVAIEKSTLEHDAQEIEKTIELESESLLREFKEEDKSKNIAKEAEKEQEKKGFFSFIKEKITTKKISEEKFNELFWEFEMALLENSVAVEVIDKIKNDLKEKLVDKPIPRKEVENIVLDTLKHSIESLFDQEKINLLENIDKKIKQGKPYVICFVGVNGSGKTTTIAKIAYMLKEKGYTPVIAAADTFRAAAIDQLEEHANRLGVKLIKHDYNADPAAVAYDAIKHAESKGKNVVLIDTAGRLHSNTNLMEELHKIIKVAKPDLTLFIGEAITGNDCIEQAREFNKMTKIDGIILSKADIDQKGGAAISISYVLQKPILYLGVGQNYEDLRSFSKEFIMENLSI